MKRWLVTSAALGLAASLVAYAILLTMEVFHVRLIAMLIWPTGLFLLANEGRVSSSEVAINFIKAIGGNVVLYAALGTVVFGLTTAVRKVVNRGRHEA